MQRQLANYVCEKDCMFVVGLIAFFLLRVIIGGFLFPLFSHKIMFSSHVPWQIFEMFPGKIMPYKNRETLL